MNKKIKRSLSMLCLLGTMFPGGQSKAMKAPSNMQKDSLMANIKNRDWFEKNLSDKPVGQWEAILQNMQASELMKVNKADLNAILDLKDDLLCSSSDRFAKKFLGSAPKALGKFGVLLLALSAVGAAQNTVKLYLERVYGLHDQRVTDQQTKKSLEGSNCIFNNIDTEWARSQMMTLKAQYPYLGDTFDDIVNFVCSYIDIKKEDPKASLPLLSLYGEPGCGKTSLLKALLRSIGLNPVVISPSDVDKANTKFSPVHQLFVGFRTKVGNNNVQVDSIINKALRTNPDTTVLLFDDADKFDKEVIQVFWNLPDGGLLKVGQNYIDTSKIWAMVTSNSSIDNMADEFVSNEDDSNSESGSLSAKAHYWAKSVKRRFFTCHVKNPRSEDYKNKLKDLLEQLKTKYAGIQLAIDDSTLDAISEHFVNNGKCMSNIKEARIMLNGSLLNLRSKRVANAKLTFENEKLSFK